MKAISWCLAWPIPRPTSTRRSRDASVEEVKAFIDEHGITYPVLMDTSSRLFGAYGVVSFPTTFMIDKDGNVFGYVSGMLTADVMDSIVEQTISGVRS